MWTFLWRQKVEVKAGRKYSRARHFEHAIGDSLYGMGNDLMVSESDKLLVRILRGTSDTDIPFERMCRLLRHLGFEERTRGSHHIFTRNGVEEILNLQTKAGRVKPYQVKQVRQVILKYRLGGRKDEQ
jgi:hypothetical protein